MTRGNQLNMTELKFNRHWRQVRIFTSDFSNQWYLGLLSKFVLGLAKSYPATPIWFTRYTGGDTGDTNFSSLPSQFTRGPNREDHLSIRLRFCPISDEEDFIKSKIDSSFWWSDFRDYDALDTFSKERFGDERSEEYKVKRAKSTADLLCANCRYVLNLLEDGGGTFETNGDINSEFTGNSFQTMIHLMSQVMGKNGYDPLPLFWQDPKNPHRFISTASR